MDLTNLKNREEPRTLPIYEYECTSCAHRFELRRNFNETDTASCPRCGCHPQRIFSSVPIIFKGAGFYVTDHRNTNHSPSADGTGEVKTSTEGKKTNTEGKKTSTEGKKTNTEGKKTNAEEK